MSVETIQMSLPDALGSAGDTSAEPSSVPDRMGRLAQAVFDLDEQETKAQTKRWASATAEPINERGVKSDVRTQLYRDVLSLARHMTSASKKFEGERRRLRTALAASAALNGIAIVLSLVLVLN